MQEERQFRGPLRFGIFEVDLRSGELRKHGLRIRLQEQPFQLLIMLLEHHGEVVTREELQKRLWPAENFRDLDHGLNKVINKVREALGDSAENPRFVETVARRGYRFLAEVKGSDSAIIRPPELATLPQPAVEPRNGLAAISKPEKAKPERRHSQLAPKLLVLVLLALIASFAAWKSYLGHRTPRVIRSLAVLPLENLSGDASQNYFADGMTDELISDLGQISALRVISRTTMMAYKHVHRPLPQIARELNVDAVVEGTVLRSGDQVRITAQLIEALADKHVWSGSYQGELRDTLGLQNKVAKAIADQIQISVNPQEQAILKGVTVVNPQAYESYLKGRFFWNKRTSDSLRVALAYFKQAVEEDPNYAQAYSGLADTYALLGDWQYAVMTTKEALPRAKAAAIQALKLDHTLADAHNSLAFCLDGFDWDWVSADREFRRAIELNPGLANAHHWYAWHLSLLGRNNEAIAEMKKAENLDPLSLIINADLAELFVITRFYDEAVLQSRRTIELDPNFGPAHNQLGQAYFQKHMNNEAVVELQKAVQLSGESPIAVANLARALMACGRRSEAVKLLSDLQATSTSNNSHAAEIAMIYASLGDNGQAIHWLEKGYDERFNPGTLLRPGFDSLRGDPRFVELTRRIGLTTLNQRSQ
jgi:TolB-like protein/DNA-binding winged helix-turn-helix (wHTH) protein/Flp pilus assembly protein TadD